MQVEVGPEHSKIRLESAETMLRLLDVRVEVEQVRVLSRPIRLILLVVDLLQMGTSR